MKKKHLIHALKDFNDDDELMLGESCLSFVPEIKRICGKSISIMAYYCCLPPGHEGQCYSSNKNVDFTPDE